MKNVAGYDVSRLLAGSLGTLGFISEVSLKILPRVPAESTLRLEMPQQRAIEVLNRWAGQPLPISASTWHEGELTLRLSGSAAALDPAAKTIGGETVAAEQAGAFWRSIPEQSHAFFAGPEPLWRIAVPTITPPLRLPRTPPMPTGAGFPGLKPDSRPPPRTAPRH